MSARWMLLCYFLCSCPLLLLAVTEQKLMRGMIFNNNAERCEGQRYVFQCIYQLGELNASAELWKSSVILNFDDSNIPMALKMDQRPGLSPEFVPKEYREQAVKVASGLVKPIKSDGRIISQFAWEIPQLASSDSGLYWCWIIPDDYGVSQVSRYSTLRVNRCFSDYLLFWLPLTTVALVCLSLIGLGICWLRRATKPVIRRLILISHQNDGSDCSEASLLSSAKSAWTSLLSNSSAPSSGFDETTWPVQKSTYSESLPIAQPSVKFETVYLNGSLGARLRAALRYRIGRLPSKAEWGKPNSTVNKLDTDDGTSTKLISTKSACTLPNPLADVNSRFMSMYCLETPDTNYELPRENLIIGSFLGGGAFGVVYSGVAKDLPGRAPGSQSVAVKTLRDNFAESDVVDLLKEMEIMKQLQFNKHVIQLLAVCTKKGAPCLILEHAPHGNLRDYLRTQKYLFERSDSTIALLLNYGIQVAEGMTYLSSRSIIHRDLAARNILVGTNYVLKISDFGLTRNVEYYYRKLTNGRLPIKWLAPESLFERVYTTKSDVWSYGVLLWEIFSFGCQPFRSVDPAAVPALIRSGGRNPKPKIAPDHVYTLMRACWEWDPKRRPSFAELHQKLITFESTLKPKTDGSIESTIPTPTSSLSTFWDNRNFGESKAEIRSSAIETSAYSDLEPSERAMDNSTLTQYLEVRTTPCPNSVK